MTNQNLIDYLNQPRTNREISEYFQEAPANVRGRLQRLRKNGLVKECETKVQCPITGRRAFAYVKNESK